MSALADEIAEGYQFFARRHGIVAQAIRPAIEAALTLAGSSRREALDEADEIASVFYGFARHPRCFPHAFRAMTTLLALAEARKANLCVNATDVEFGTLCIDVASNAVGFSDVCAWFAERLEPINVRVGLSVVS